MRTARLCLGNGEMLNKLVVSTHLKRCNTEKYIIKNIPWKWPRGLWHLRKHHIAVTPGNGSILITEKGSRRQTGRDRVVFDRFNFKIKKKEGRDLDDHDNC